MSATPQSLDVTEAARCRQTSIPRTIALGTASVKHMNFSTCHSTRFNTIIGQPP